MTTTINMDNEIIYRLIDIKRPNHDEKINTQHVNEKFRRLSLLFHPDKWPDPRATVVTQALIACKNILTDTELEKRCRTNNKIRGIDMDLIKEAFRTIKGEEQTLQRNIQQKPTNNKQTTIKNKTQNDKQIKKWKQSDNHTETLKNHRNMTNIEDPLENNNTQQDKNNNQEQFKEKEKHDQSHNNKYKREKTKQCKKNTTKKGPWRGKFLDIENHVKRENSYKFLVTLGSEILPIWLNLEQISNNPPAITRYIKNIQRNRSKAAAYLLRDCPELLDIINSHQTNK